MDDRRSEEELGVFEETTIKFENVVFLAFHPLFKSIILFIVLVRTFMSPLRLLRSPVVCNPTTTVGAYANFIYHYCSDIVYSIDIVFHLAHRQVRDTAMRRPYLPKPVARIFVDIASVIPVFELILPNYCHEPVKMYPHILSLMQFLVIYRIIDYFQIVKNHSTFQYFFGSVLLLLICLNAVNCVWILFTLHGFCPECIYDVSYNETSQDWRSYLNGLEIRYDHLAMQYICSLFNVTISSRLLVHIRGNLLLTALQTMILLIFYFSKTFLFMPKVFLECLLIDRHKSDFQNRVAKILRVVKRRTKSPKIYNDIQKFYQVMWIKRSGTLTIPNIMYELPKYFITEIKEDLYWSVFFHSPTFRRTTIPYRRWLSDCIKCEFNMPGDRLHNNASDRCNLYYIKTGIVQLLSSEDKVTPILTVTSGTIFGDINFIIPGIPGIPGHGKVGTRCVTYCEVHYLTRQDILRSFHKFPEDRRMIMHRARERIKHAKDLQTIKESYEDMSRTEDIAWIKRRWWLLRDLLHENKIKSKLHQVELPAEEAAYHCSKYIGQLVLYSEAHLHNRAIFFDTKFPFILAPGSTAVFIWNVILKVTVLMVLFTYPPALKELTNNFEWAFQVLRFWTDFVYLVDIIIYFLIYTKKDENPTSFLKTAFEKCISGRFLLDVLSTCLVTKMIDSIGLSEYNQLFQYCKLIKIYVLFNESFFEQQDFKMDLFTKKVMRSALIVFSYIYIGSYLIFFISGLFNNLDRKYLFCRFFLRSKENVTDFNIIKAWIINIARTTACLPNTVTEVYTLMGVRFLGYFLMVFVNGHLISTLYLKHRSAVNFQSKINSKVAEYIHYNIHPDLLKRAEKYLVCQWKSLSVQFNLLNEPHTVYHTVHDRIVEKIIRGSSVFKRADPDLIKELAHVAKFIILPQYATVFLIGTQCDIISWNVNGIIKQEYGDFDGQVTRRLCANGEVLSIGSVFFGGISLGTYVAWTDIELLYIPTSMFWRILKRYPFELELFRQCQKEFSPVYKKYLAKYMVHNLDYRRTLLKNETYDQSILEPDETEESVIFEKGFWNSIWIHPESKFTQSWARFRICSIVVAIISWNIQDGIGAMYIRQLHYICLLCDIITALDIFVKLFLAYYNEDGIIVHNTQMCMAHYLRRGFCMDVIGILPWHRLVGEHFTKTQNILVMTLSRMSLLYMFDGYINMFVDKPNSSFVTAMIVKVQIVGFLMTFLTTQLELVRCVGLKWGQHQELLNITALDQCYWHVSITVGTSLSETQLKKFYLSCFMHSLYDFARCSHGFDPKIYMNQMLFMVIIIAYLVFWFIYLFCIALLVLKFRGNSLYQDGVRQLQTFLQEERVEKPLIKRSVDYYLYLRNRTLGVGSDDTFTEGLGFVLNQDLGFYFFRRTFMELGAVLDISPYKMRVLAAASEVIYMKAGEDIMREMDVVTDIFIVHRGHVTVTKKQKVIDVVSKGAIFGQLMGKSLRPVRVTVRTEEPADIICMKLRTFRNIIEEKTMIKIEEHPDSKNDYIPTTRNFIENPYNTIEYLVKGSKIIQLPWMTTPRTASDSPWYANVLMTCWLIEPTISSALAVLYILDLREEDHRVLVILFLFLDVVHVTHSIIDYLYSLETVVVNGKCQLSSIKYDIRQQLKLSADLMCVLPPYVSFFTDMQALQLARIIRLRFIYLYHKHFCGFQFQNDVRDVIFRFVALCLGLHLFCCFYIKIVCEDESDVNFKYPCEFNGLKAENSSSLWYHDYMYAVAYVIHQYTGQKYTYYDTAIVPVVSVFFEFILLYVMYIVNIVVISKVICKVFIKLRKLYTYDYYCRLLLNYLRDAGLSPVILKMVDTYTLRLWERQKGSWIPELALRAPQCLREDIMCSLYLHHLHVPTMFRNIPHYFLRQLASRFYRVVVFPEKHIVQAGDISPYVYFINEGEVEKYYLDTNGEKRLMGILTTNGHFGVISGLFPDTPFSCYYYTRTVVDLVYLKSEDLQSILDSYPDIKSSMMNSARELGMELGIHEAYFKS